MSTSINSSAAIKRYLILAVSFAFMIFFRFVPGPEGLSASAMQVIGIFIGIIILWMTQGIDWTSILCIGMLAFVPELSMDDLLKASFGNSIFAFLVFTFMCTYCLNKTPFIRRCALAFVTNKVARKSPWAFVILYFAAIFTVGSFISSTICALIFVALSEEIFEVLGLKKGSQIGNMIMMGVVVISGITGGVTPIAHAYPLLSFGVFETATGLTIDYAKYIITGIPVGVLTIVGMLLIFRFILRPDMSEIKSLDVRSLKEALPAPDYKEKACTGIFICVIALWIAPSLIKPILPGVYKYINSFGNAMPPLLGVVALAILTYEGKPILDFKEATSKGITWASPIMAAGTLAIGAALTNENIGLSRWLSDTIGPIAAGLAPMAVVALFVAWTLIQTNLASNTVTASMVAAIATPIIIAIPAINDKAMITMIGMLAAYGFTTPSSMIAVVFGVSSGWTTTGQMIKYGCAVGVIAFLAGILVGYPIASAIM